MRELENQGSWTASRWKVARVGTDGDIRRWRKRLHLLLTPGLLCNIAMTILEMDRRCIPKEVLGSPPSCSSVRGYVWPGFRHQILIFLVLLYICGRLKSRVHHTFLDRSSPRRRQNNLTVHILARLSPWLVRDSYNARSAPTAQCLDYTQWHHTAGTAAVVDSQCLPQNQYPCPSRKPEKVKKLDVFVSCPHPEPVCFRSFPYPS
jgi:hypothetical protein